MSSTQLCSYALGEAGLEIERHIEKHAHGVLETCFENSIDPDQLASEDIHCFPLCLYCSANQK